MTKQNRSHQLWMQREEAEAQQLVIEQLQKRRLDVSLKLLFGPERFSASDDNIRFQFCYLILNLLTREVLFVSHQDCVHI